MNSTTNDTFLHLLQSIPQTLYDSAGLVLFIVGTIGNLLAIISFSRLESLNTLASSLFLLASFIGSEVVLITGILPRIFFGLTGGNPVFNSLFLCKARMMLKIAGATFSMTCVGLAAIDRYFFSCLELRRQQWITLQQTRLTIFIIAMFWLVVAVPYAVFYTTTNSSTCSVVDSIFAYFVPGLNLVFYNLAPIIILTIICALTWRNLGRQIAFYLRGTIRYYDQATLLIVSQIITIVVTTFANAIWQIYTIATQKTSKSALRVAQEAIVTTVLGLPSYGPYTIMFYVYLIVSPAFRRNVKRLFLRTQRISPMRNVGPVRKSSVQIEPRHMNSTF